MLLFGFIYLGFVGFLDDFQKTRFKSSLSGLSELGKTILILLFIFPFTIFYFSEFCSIPQEIKTNIYIPFYKNPVINIGEIGFIIFIFFTMFSIINAVNITDGLDGLLSGTSSLTIGVYSILAYIMGNSIVSSYYLFPYIKGVGEVTVFGAALVGSLLGFLWYNSYPAEMFMGDTGSLAIGGVLAMMVFFTRQEMLFLIAGGIFVFEILTSLLQEKIGNRMGRRIVYRAPFHHTMTHRGIAEPKAVLRLWIIAIILAAISLLSLKVR
jgi:phospho-N-acetylmuramoyl-pentapeptide-transferase